MLNMCSPCIEAALEEVDTRIKERVKIGVIRVKFKNLKERNVGTEEKSPEQGLTRAKEKP